MRGTNVEEGATIRVTQDGKSRVIKDLNAADQQRRPQEPRDLDGQANGSISFDISNQGPTLVQVDNPRAPDFQFTLPADRLQTGFKEGENLSLRPNSGPFDHAPHMSAAIGLDDNGGTAQLKINADLSQQQVDHYQTATNGNLNGHMGSGNVGLDSQRIAGQLVDGTASNTDVKRTLDAVETQRNLKTHAAADALADFMNTGLPILKNVPRPSSAGLDPAKAQSDLEDLHKTMQRDVNTINSLSRTYYDRVAEAIDAGVNPEHLGQQLERLLPGKTGRNGNNDAIADIQNQMSKAVSDWYKGVANVLDESRKAVGKSADNKTIDDAFNKATLIMDIATNSSGALRSLVKNLRPSGQFAKTFRAYKNQQQARKIQQNVNNSAKPSSVDSQINRSPEMNPVQINPDTGHVTFSFSRPDPTAKPSKEFGELLQKAAEEKAFKTELQSTVDTAENAFQKDLRKSFGAAVDWGSGAVGTARFGTFRSNSNTPAFKPGITNTEPAADGADVSFFDDTRIPDPIANTEGYKSYQKVGEGISRDSLGNKTDFVDGSLKTTYGEIEDSAYDLYTMPRPADHVSKVNDNVKEAMRLNEEARANGNNSRYFVVDERYSRGRLYRGAFVTRIVEAKNWGFSDPVTANDVRVGNNTGVFSDYKRTDQYTWAGDGLGGFMSVRSGNTRSSQADYNWYRYIPGAFA